MMYGEENLNKCLAYKKGVCLFGCDAISDSFYSSEEALEKNYFDYYLNNKVCETLRRVKEDDR